MAAALRRVLDADCTAGPGEDGSAGPPLLLLGAPRSAQTSLLFAAALEAAGEGRGPVLFLTRRPLQSLPLSTPAARDHWRLQVAGGLDSEVCRAVAEKLAHELQFGRPMTARIADLRVNRHKAYVEVVG